MRGRPPSNSPRDLWVWREPPRTVTVLCRACRAVLYQFHAKAAVPGEPRIGLTCPACGAPHVARDLAGRVAATRALVDTNLAAAGYLGAGAA